MSRSRCLFWSYHLDFLLFVRSLWRHVMLLYILTYRLNQTMKYVFHWPCPHCFHNYTNLFLTNRPFAYILYITWICIYLLLLSRFWGCGFVVRHSICAQIFRVIFSYYLNIYFFKHCFSLLPWIIPINIDKPFDFHPIVWRLSIRMRHQRYFNTGPDLFVFY